MVLICIPCLLVKSPSWQFSSRKVSMFGWKFVVGFRCYSMFRDSQKNTRLLLRDQIDLGIVNVQSAFLLHVELDRLQ